MRSVSAYAIKSRSIVLKGMDVLEIFYESLKEEKFEIRRGDVVVISSKITSMEEERIVDLSSVEISDDALKYASKTNLDPAVVELILTESGGEVIGNVNKSLLVRTKYGIFSNAGVDTSNVPKGQALLLPEDCNLSAKKYHKRISSHFNFEIPVIIADTKSIPLRWGSMGVALGYFGLKPLLDYRGQKDLFGNTIKFSMRGIADNIATIGTVTMGEIAEQTPFAVIRGVKFERSEEQKTRLDLEPEHCLYFGPFLKSLRE